MGKIFCPSCGSVVDPPDAHFCAHCGASVSSIRSTASNLSTQTPEKAPPQQIADSHRPDSPEKKTNNFRILIGIVCFIVIFSLIAVGSWYYIVGLFASPGSGTARTNDEIITKSLDSIALTLNDFPMGWSMRPNNITSTHLHQQFQTGGMYDTQAIRINVDKYDTVAIAISKYNTLWQQTSNINTEHIDIGDDGFYYYIDSSTGSLVRVCFRNRNLVAQIDYVGYYIFPDDALQYANLLNNKI